MKDRYKNYLARCLCYLYPEADPTSDFVVMDEGQGSYLAEWNLDLPEPTEKEIDSALLEVLKKDKKDEMKRRAIGGAIQSSPDPDVNTLEDLFLLVLPALYMQAVAGVSIRKDNEVFTASAPRADLGAMMGNFQHYYNKKDVIERATSVEEIEPIIWEN